VISTAELVEFILSAASGRVAAAGDVCPFFLICVTGMAKTGPIVSAGETEGNGPSAEVHRAEAYRPRQFSLRAMLGFTVLCALYAAQNAAMGELAASENGLLDWPSLTAIALAWTTLAVFYLAHDMKLIAAVHCIGPALLIDLAAMAPSQGSSLAALLRSAAIGCAVCTTVSFPLSIIRIMVKAWRAPSESGTADERG
jgi:hypothetical protein